jgi:hypothetical protein
MLNSEKQSQLFSSFEYLDEVVGQVVRGSDGAIFQLALFCKKWLCLGRRRRQREMIEVP